MRTGHVTAAFWEARLPPLAGLPSTWRKCSTASHTSVKLVYSGVKPKRSVRRAEVADHAALRDQRLHDRIGAFARARLTWLPRSRPRCAA